MRRTACRVNSTLPNRNGSASSSPLTATTSIIGLDSRAAVTAAVQATALRPATSCATAAASSTDARATTAPSSRSGTAPPSSSTAR